MISETMLRRYVNGSLDPAEMALVADWVRIKPALRSRMQSMQRDQAHPDSMWVPHELLFNPAHRMGAQAEMIMGATAPTSGAALQLEIGQSLSIAIHPEAPDDAIVVCLQRVPGAAWKVLFPTSPDQVSTKSVFARPDSTHQVRIVVGGPVGLHEWVVVAVDAATQIDWSADPDARWQPVLEANPQDHWWQAVQIEVLPDSEQDA